MSKQLILAEKPSVGKEIARVLGAKESRGTYIEGANVIVTWAYGHLVTHADPEVYDKRYANWTLDDLPILPDRLKLVVMPKTGRQFQAIKELLHRKDVSEVVIATDAGREGELVARWILEKAGNQKPLKRLWISSVTDSAIRTGFQTLKPAKQYENLFHAAVARAEGDWLVGINATRALTTKYNIPLSCGRVQTPTLAMVKHREDVIRRFVPKDYFGIDAKVDGVVFHYQNINGQKTTFDEALIDKVLSNLNGISLSILRINKKTKSNDAPPLYDLTELQKQAHALYGFSPKKTLTLMQRLYEHHKALTYPRTDSKHLTTDMVGTLKERLIAIKDDPYKNIAQNLIKTGYTLTKGVVDNAKVSDHHAIIPTEVPLNSRHVEREEWLIYEMVVKRFLGVLMPAYSYEEMTVEAKAKDQLFSIKGNRTLDMGWKLVTQHTAEVNELPTWKTGQTLAPVHYIKTKGQTSPPPYYTEGTLLAAMENPPLDVEEKEDASDSLKKTLGETGGLGTVATRADIIEKLFNGFLIELKGQQVHITNKGKQLLEVAPTDLKSPLLTAKWEQKLEKISKGQLKPSDFVQEMRHYTKLVVSGVKGATTTFKHDNVTTTPCPTCSKKLLAVQTKTGKSLVCPDRTCGYRESIARETNARCPECKKKLTLVAAGDDKLFTCKCGYRERLSAFEKRKKEEGNKGNRSDVEAYKRAQEKEEQEKSAANNPFAKLLNLDL